MLLPRPPPLLQSARRPAGRGRRRRAWSPWTPASAWSSTTARRACVGAVAGQACGWRAGRHARVAAAHPPGGPRPHMPPSGLDIALCSPPTPYTPPARRPHRPHRCRCSWSAAAGCGRRSWAPWMRGTGRLSRPSWPACRPASPAPWCGAWWPPCTAPERATERQLRLGARVLPPRPRQLKRGALYHPVHPPTARSPVHHCSVPLPQSPFTLLRSTCVHGRAACLLAFVCSAAAAAARRPISRPGPATGRAARSSAAAAPLTPVYLCFCIFSL